MLEERQKTHGEFSSHAAITQALKAVVHNRKSWGSLSADKKESIDMILHKIGRVLNGNAETKDHWDDIAGYATLVANRVVTDKVSLDRPSDKDITASEILRNRIIDAKRLNKLSEEASLESFLSTVAMMAKFGHQSIEEIVRSAKTTLGIVEAPLTPFGKAMAKLKPFGGDQTTLFSKQESV